jgi:hypothetical protein
VGEKTVNLFNIDALTMPTDYKAFYGNVVKTEYGYKCECLLGNSAFRLSMIIPKDIFENGKQYTISCAVKNVRIIRIG